MITWLLAFVTGPVVLALYLCHLIRGPRQRRMGWEQVRQLQILSNMEQYENDTEPRRQGAPEF